MYSIQYYTCIVPRSLQVDVTFAPSVLNVRKHRQDATVLAIERRRGKVLLLGAIIVWK
jgi:hypothetical protein